ncbi:MAG TPA: hypothetical protein VNE39_18005 [Planctomycetota bacterium]|nr:hypothetical protein [Planctomycetota bacterium]
MRRTCRLHCADRRLVRPPGRQNGFAILMVVLVLVGLIIIGAPFAISMRQEEMASVNFAARAHAKLVATGALNLAKAQLERSHESYEHLEVRNALAGTGTPTIYDSPYVDCSGELRVSFTDGEQLGFDPAALANPAGAMWSARAEDEQGKINVRTAPRVLLRNLLLEALGETFDPADPDATRAAQIAAQVDDYRRDHPITSLTQLRTASTILTEPEYQRVVRFLTVHSAPFVSETSSTSVPQYPVNVNTCPIEVLRALLRGIKLRQPGLPADEQHKGVGYATTSLDTDDDGVGDKTITDDFVELVRRLRVFARLAADVAEGSTTVALDDATLFPQPRQSDPAGQEVDGFWLSIEGDAVRYWKKEGASLSVSQSPDYLPTSRVDRARKADPLEPVEVRLLFTDIAHDLAGVLDALVAEEKLTPESKAAILANAINPLNATVLDLATTTGALCTHSFNIYTIEATGVMNAPDGRELARYTVKEVAQVAPSVELDIRIDTQEDFQHSFHAGLAQRLATWPNATEVSDVAPSSTEPPETLLIPRHGRLGLPPVEYSPEDPVRFSARFTQRFHGPLLDEVLEGDRDGGTDSVWPQPFRDLTTVDPQPGEYSDLGPEGLHVGKVERTVGATTTSEVRTLVYPARMEGKDADGKTVELNNVPHSGDNVVQPLVVEFWMKLDSDPKVGGSVKLDYTLDRVLFDLGHQSFSNRLVLMYYGRDATSGDVVLHVCDSTNQLIAAQVRCRVGSSVTPLGGLAPDQWFQILPDRWYHVVATVKGIRYNEMGLCVNGRSVGRYFPVARTSGAALDAAAIPCTGTISDDPRYNDPTTVFRLQPWPVAGCAVLGGEIFEYTGVDSAFTILADIAGLPVGRGSRATQARLHGDGTRIEIHGYTDYIHKDSSETGEGDTEHLLVNMMDATQEPWLLSDLPAAFLQVTVDDGDEANPTGAPAPTATTADDTNQFWDQFATSYEAWTGNADNTVPSGDWLPLFASEKWIVPSAKDGGAIADDETQFATVVADPGFLSMLTWTALRPTTAKRVVEEPVDGIGLLTLEANPDALEAKDREAIKFAKAGVVLVWRFHPTDVDDPETPEDDRRQIAWYIGYLAGFDETATAYAGCRACFDTTKADIVEGAKLRLNCIKLNTNQNLPRGHRGVQTITHELVGTDATIDELRDRNGRGIFQITYPDAEGKADPNPYRFEWIQFTYPRFPWPPVPEGDEDVEEKVLASKFVYDISRAVANTGDAEHKPIAFPAAPGSRIMPVFFCSGYIHVMDKDIDLVKGSHDEVTLTDNTGQREDHWVHHGWGRMFAFRESILPPPAHVFSYINRPRLVKFPASMPIEPDRYFYLGSDSMYRDGDPKAEAHDGPVAGEPERPANATFDEVKIHSATYGIARLWDCKLTAGAPDPAKEIRDFGGIPAGAAPPFYVRIGNLEDFVPQADPPAEPFRFHHNGHVGSWPLEGYVKVDDEVLFYRVVYRRPEGRTSAPIKFTRPVDGDGNPLPFANDLVTVLDENGTTLYLDLTEEEAQDFPDMGYLTISNAWANLSYWQRIQEIMGAYGVTWDDIDADLQKGEEVRDANGRLINSSHYIGSEERVFFNGKHYDTGKNALEITLTHRGILNSTRRKVQMYDPATTSGWFLNPDGKSSNASVSVISVELLILERACLGSLTDAHVLGARANPLDHIHCSLAPRKMVKLQRDEFGRLLLEDGEIKALADDDAAFDISKPEYEYGIVVEYHDNFPAEGYVQIGNEIVGYAQDKNGSTPIWTARLPDAAAPDGYREIPVLTGIKLLRQRYGTTKEDYLTPGAASVVATVDPDKEEPIYYADAGGTHGRRIVRLREARFHDRYPISNTGEFTPHRASAPVGYWEFAYSLPGALWSQVTWTEAKYDEAAGVLINDRPLDANDPWDIQLMVQLDNAPAWDDTAVDPATSKPVAQPVPWQTVPTRTDVVYDPPGYRLKKPVTYLFDDPAANNYLNARDASTPLGQYADRIRLRVYFKHNAYQAANGAPPNYNIPWRTPWVDTITLRYRAPTHIFEHREMPY